MPHIWMSHGTHTSESCYTCEWDMSHNMHEYIFSFGSCGYVAEWRWLHLQIITRARKKRHTHTHTRTHTHAHTHTHKHTHTHTHTQAHTHTHTHTHAVGCTSGTADQSKLGTRKCGYMRAHVPRKLCLMFLRTVRRNMMCGGTDEKHRFWASISKFLINS